MYYDYMDKYSALSDPTRRKIMELLASQGPLSAREIAVHFHSSFPAISQHLKTLRETGLVCVEKKAQQRIYHMNPDEMREIEEWTLLITRLWNQRLDALDRLLQVEKQKSERMRNMETQTTKKLTIIRVFDAPRVLVFRAFSEAEMISQWWPPQGWTMPVCMLDFRPGGEWRYCFRNAQGDEHWARAVYTQIDPPHQIVYRSDFIDAQGKPLNALPTTVFTFTFEEISKKTQLTVHVEGETPADLEQIIAMGFETGFAQTMDNLEQYLLKLNQ
jgi:uncharacterized protein YndB with AHSA1/START domain/DNA-binding transcriptional ArsR family regulator